MYPYASDAEDSDDALTFSIDSETNSSLIDCSISGDRYLSCGTPASNQTGYNDVTVKVIDTGSLTDTDVVRITVNPVNDAQTITTASDSPDPVTVGNDVTFSVDWNDVDDTTTRIHICKTNSITGQSCNGGNWCESPSFTSNDPATCAYTTQSADIATSPNNYYAFACDDDNACSSSSSGTFTVQSAAGGGNTVFFNGFEDSNMTGKGFNLSVWEVRYGTDNDEADTQATYKKTGTYASHMEEGDEADVDITIKSNYLDLTGKSNCNLSYWYTSYSIEAADYIYVDIYDGSWHTGVKNYSNGNCESRPTFCQDSINLNSYTMTSDFRARWRTESSGDDDEFYLDNVNITCS